MKINYLLALTCGVGLAVASCSQDGLDSAGQDARTVITATIGEPEHATRSAIDPTIYAEGHIGILWTPDDMIGVYNSTLQNVCFTNALEDPAGMTKFTGNCESPLRAYYPYNPANDGVDPTALRGSLAAEQYFNAETRKIDGDYKIGTPRNGAADEFTFTHIFALLQLQVNATGTGVQGETLKSVTIQMPRSRQLCGDFTFNLETGAYSFTGNTSSSLKVMPEQGAAMGQGATIDLFASCAPDFKTDDEITFIVTTDKHTATFTRHIAYDFEANSVYTFNLDLSLYSDLKVEELPAEPEEETANCYMITTAGAHDFKATVIGNGQKGIIPGAGFHTEDASINPRSARLLWEDVNGFVTDVTLSGGRVHYNTTGNVGNAVIAVYDGPNATGNILWSWHIWGVGDTLPESYDYATKDGVVNQIMDRDLGAFPATDEQRLQTTRVAEDENYVCHAMLYQWGRKDPMPNSLTRYVDGQAVDLTSFPVWKGASKEEHTIAASIQHPMELINRYEGNNDGDWLGQDVELLWGDAKFSGSDKTGRWTNVKTIYDPSPVGYRVPGFETFGGFVPGTMYDKDINGVSSYRTVNGEKVPTLAEYINCVIDQVATSTWLPKGIHKTTIGKAAGSTSNSDKIFGYGIYMKRFDGDTEGAYYPATGYLFPNVTTGNRSYFAKNSYRWLSCGGVSNTNGKSCFYLSHFYWKTSSYSTGVDAGLYGNSGVNGGIKTHNTSYPWCAYAVRCVKEQ